MSTATEGTMLAAVYHGRRDVRVENVPVVEARTGELLLEVATVGVCGTDAAEWSKGAAQYPVDRPHAVTGHHGPIVIGHEFSGRVVDVGEGVDPSWLDALVASCGALPCGDCPECAAGRTNRCRRYAAIGLHRDGAMTRFVSVPAKSCVRVDHLGLSADEAALGQPLAIAVHAARRSGIMAPERAVVFGVGGIGAFLVHVLVQWRIDVTAVDLDAERLQVATELGAARTVLAGTDDDAGAIGAAAGAPVEVVFEVTGSPAGLRNALSLSPTGGRIVLAGLQKQPLEIELYPVTLGEQTIIGTNALIRETDFPEAVRLLALRRGGWQIIAPTVLPLSDLVSGALEPMAAGHSPAIKLLVDPKAVAARPSQPGRPSPLPPPRET